MSAPEEPETATDVQLADESLPLEIDAAIPIALDQILPWHKPRKQYIRERQWIAFSRSLIEREFAAGRLQAAGSSARPEIKYLTLPGYDYLDVKMLGEVSRELNCDLTCTGFLSGDESNPVTARAKIREESLVKSGLITDASHTFPRRIEEVASTSSQAYRDLRRRAPFHVVNIDACGSLALPSADHAQRLVDAVYRIVELQFETNAGPWMLFLTNDVRKDTLSNDTLDKLSSAIVENAKKNQDFAYAAVDCLGPEQLDIDNAIAAAASGPSDTFLRLFATGLGKWLLDLAEKKQRGVRMHNSYWYSTASDGADATMPCLAFEFLGPPPGLQDDLGVTRVSPKEGGPTEDLSVRIATKVSEISDLDNLMAADDAIRAEMTEQTKSLLRDAGYAAPAIDSI